jgi:hypothetical protein
LDELGELHFSRQSRHDKLQYFSSTLSLSIPVPRTTRGYFQLVTRKAVHCLHYLDVILMFKLARAAGVHPYLVSWEEVFCALPSASSLPLTDSSFCYTAVSAAAPLLIATHSTQHSRAQPLQTAHSTVGVSSFRHYETLKWICVGLPGCKGQQLRYKYQPDCAALFYRPVICVPRRPELLNV